jgi:hypothetical protein
VLTSAQFAWTPQDNTQEYLGCLATSVSEFKGCGDIESDRDLPVDFETTNRGIRFNLPLYCAARIDGRGNHFVHLRCHHRSLGPFFLRLSPTVNGYARYNHDFLVSGPFPAAAEKVPRRLPFHIRKTINSTESSLLTRQNPHRFVLRVDNRTSLQQDEVRASSSCEYWDGSCNAFHTLLDKWNFEGQIDIRFRLVGVSEDLMLRLIVRVGLRPKEDQLDKAARALIPWAAVYQRYRGLHGVKLVTGLRYNQWWLSGEDTNPAISFMPSAELPTSLNVRAENTKSWHDYVKEHSPMCSVSTNVDLERESGIYEVVLLLEEEWVSHA